MPGFGDGCDTAVNRPAITAILRGGGTLPDLIIGRFADVDRDGTLTKHC